MQARPIRTAAPATEPAGLPVFVFGPAEFVHSVKESLAETGDLRLIGHSGDLKNAPSTAPLYAAQVVIVDANAGGPLKGMDCARMIQRAYPRCSPLIVTPTVSEEIARWLSLEGRFTWSVVSTRTLARISEFSAAVHSTARGLPWIQPELKRVVKEYGFRTRKDDSGDDEGMAWAGRIQRVGVGPDPTLLRRAAGHAPRPFIVPVIDISGLPAGPAAGPRTADSDIEADGREAEAMQPAGQPV